MTLSNILFSYSTYLKNKTNLEIPHSFHFIWIGSMIPEEYKINILNWKILHPGTTINLWIDSKALSDESINNFIYIDNSGKTMPCRDISTFNTYNKDNNKINIDREQGILNQLISFASDNNIILHDICSHEAIKHITTQPFYNDWVNGKDSNFAIAADYLRLAILYIEGGIYLDIDTKPKKCIFDEFNEDNKYHFYMWGIISASGEYKFQDNCVIAAGKFNHIVKEMLNTMIQNYHRYIIMGDTEIASLNPSVGPKISNEDSNIKIQDKISDWSCFWIRTRSIPANDARRAGFLGAIPMVATANEIIPKNERTNCILIGKNFVIHTRTKSWTFIPHTHGKPYIKPILPCAYKA